MDYGYKIANIKNYSLNTDLVEIVAPSGYIFSEIICTTSDGTGILIATEEGGDTFPISETRGTMPMSLMIKNAIGAETSLFWAAVESDTTTLSILFSKK